MDVDVEVHLDGKDGKESKDNVYPDDAVVVVVVVIAAGLSTSKEGMVTA
jgi:hypothetical protein